MNEDDARAVRSREALLNAALALLTEDPGASLQDVARRAGVGRATLYRHFATREALVGALASECLRRTDEAVAPLASAGLSARDRLEATIHCVMPLAAEFHFLLSLWHLADTDDAVAATYQRQLDDLGTLVDAAKADGAIATELSTEWVVASLDALLCTAWWMVGQGRFSVEDGATLVVRGLLHGVADTGG